MRVRSIAPVWVGVAVLGAAIVVYSANQLAEGGVSPPDSTPAPFTGEPIVRTDDPDDSVYLDQPLAEPFDLEIAGYYFRIPEGAIALGNHLEAPPVDENGQSLGTPQPHLDFWVVSRGVSSVKIDAQTGEVFDYEVQPEDEAEFRLLTEPRRID